MYERYFLKYAPEEGIAIAMDEYMRVISVIGSSGVGVGSRNKEIFGKSRPKESANDFGNIFKTACDELKQNQATHTKTRVLTLN